MKRGALAFPNRREVRQKRLRGEISGWQGEGGTDFWLRGPSMRQHGSAEVLGNNPDSLALGLVLLAYS